MFYRTRITALLIMLMLEIAWASSTHAQAPLFNVQHNGVPVFNANALHHDPSSTVYNFCDVPAQCGSQPPPPSDPGAYTTLGVTWLTHTPITRITDVTQFANVFGHIDPNQPVQGWPYVSGTTVKMTDTSPKYLRMRIAMPINPGTLSHFLKAVSYGASPGMRARFAVVPAGGAWPTGADTPCYKSAQPFSDQTVLTLNPGAPNSVKCSVAPGSSVDVLVDANTNGTIALSFN